jgi:phenylacetic acid degradation operon negative regulatory protein
MSELPRLAALLTGGEPPRTWSVLVTVFGDLAREPGREVPSPVLARLGQGMGLSPEAVRTALHRLRKEGWVAVRRQGRHSLYSLTAAGRAQSEAAGPRIYGTEPAPRAFVVLSPVPGAGVPVGPQLRVAPRPDPAPEALSFPLDAPPDWMRAALLAPETAALARETAERLDALSRALAGLGPLPPFETAILRVLVVHAWRRVALRLPDLPDAVLPAGDAVAAARADVAGLLARLPAPPVETL